MLTTRRAGHVSRLRRLAAAGAIAALAAGLPATAEEASPSTVDQLLSAVVHLKTVINPDGRTVRGLGRERAGSGIVIDDNGLILTIGYLMVEAQSAEVVTNTGRTVAADVVGYDHDTGFGLLRAIEPLKVKPVALGRSSDVKENDQVLAVSYGGRTGLAPGMVVSRRQFAGAWEYVVDNAIFVSPAHADWSGAALITRDARLVGVGSLVVGDASGTGVNMPGNMYVPIDLLPPIMADLLSKGRVSGPGRPWLGLNADELRGRIFVGRVTRDAPAQQAGIQRNDLIVAVNGAAPRSLADFYRKVWALGAAGVSVPLDVLQGTRVNRIEVKSIHRLDHLRLKSTF
jgi:S1-C subfamily serine protease